MKFKYDYLNNRLWWKINGKYSCEISENNQFRTNNYGTYGSDGFRLSPDHHWIIFTLYPQKLRVFYKQVSKEGKIAYFRKDIYFLLERELTPQKTEKFAYLKIIEVEFSPADQVEKNNGDWIYKKE